MNARTPYRPYYHRKAVVPRNACTQATAKQSAASAVARERAEAFLAGLCHYTLTEKGWKAAGVELRELLARVAALVVT